MIKITNLVHRYAVWKDSENKEYETALDGISLDIPSGQFMAILGPNGCGKSTLAKHLNVLLLPDEGTVWIDGKDTHDAKLLHQIRTEVGMVFQNPDNQIVGTNVEEDVAFGPENKCMEPSRIREIVTKCLDIVGLGAKRRISPMRLSGGEKQRVGIAGALASSPEVLVLDEPTAMLDPNSRKEVIRVIHKLNKEHGITIVLITHHMDEVLGADNIVLMDKGHIVRTGTPEEIFSDRELIQSVKMEIPQIVDLGDRLKARGLDIKTPVLAEDYLIDRLNEILKGGSHADC